MSDKNNNLLTALELVSCEFNTNGVEVTPELLAAIIATLRKEVGATFLPVSEYSFTHCRNYNGGCDYRGRGWIQLTHVYNYETFCGEECLLQSGQTCRCAHSSGGCSENDLVEDGMLEEYIEGCPPARALLPEYAAKSFASFYISNDLVDRSNKRYYWIVGKRINGGDTYGNEFKQIALVELKKFTDNPDKTSKLLDYLNSYTPEADAIELGLPKEQPPKDDDVNFEV